MANLTSTLDIVLKDDVSRSAATIEASLKKLEADAKAVDAALGKSGTGDKFQAGLKKLGASAVHVEAVTKAWQNYAKAEQLAGSRGDWTSKQVAQVKNWESVNLVGIRAVMSADKALQAQQHARAEAQRRDAERVAHVQQHQAAHHGFGNYVAQSALMAVSAHGIMSVLEGAVEKGAEYQHRLVALQNTGRTPAELEEMNRASHAALRGVPTATLTGNLEILNETVGAFGSVEHAMEHLGFMAKSSAVLHAVAGDKIGESAGAMGNELARFFEMRGTAGNGHVFEHEASEMMRSMIFSGGNVNPRELLNFAQQAKSSLQNYDIGFLSRIAPSLIGEVGGDRAGSQANAFNSVILGKANDKKQAEAWLKYGLIDPKQMTKKGDAVTGWTGGAIYHTDEFLKNPLAAIEKYVLPALAAKGIDINNSLELTKALGTMFRNINAAAFANELAQPQNRARLHKDDRLIGQVEDLDAIYQRLLKTDPTVAFKALKDAVGNLLTTTTSPLMRTAAASLSGMASNLNELAVAADEHPMAAATAGIVTAAGALYGAGRASMAVMNGFGSSIARGISAEITGSMAGVGGAISKAIVGEVAGVVEGGITVGALEVAATGALAMSVGTVALTAAAAVLTIGALRSSMDPKHQAINDPGFGDPFAPGKKGLDPNDPNLPRDPSSMTDEERKDAAKPWYNRGVGHPRGYEPEHHDLGPHYQDLKNAPYFATAPLGPDGRPLGYMPQGWATGVAPVDPTTGSRIGFGHLPTDPALYEPAAVPIPVPRPAAAAEPAPAVTNFDGNALHRFEAPAPDITPKVDPASATDALFTLGSLSEETGAKMQTALNVTASPTVHMGSLQAYISLLDQAIAKQSQLGAIGSGANASVSARRSFQPAPAGRIAV